MSKLNKRGVVSISTFSFVIILFILLLTFTYFFYSNTNTKTQYLIEEQETLNAATSLRSTLITLTNNNNSQIEYQNVLDPNNIVISTNNSTITVQRYTSNNIIRIKLQNYGIEFCNQYNFTTHKSNTFLFNGTCISKK